MKEHYTTSVHHCYTDFIVQITRTDLGSDWEIDTVRVPSMVEGAPESHNLVAFLDQACSIVLDELQQLAIDDREGRTEMHKLEEAEEAAWAVEV